MFGGQHSEHDAAPMKLRDISAIAEPRIDMRDEELNRVLGGGMVPGSIKMCIRDSKFLPLCTSFIIYNYFQLFC